MAIKGVQFNTTTAKMEKNDAGDTIVFDGSLTVTQNLTVSGTTTTIDSTVVSIADPIFELGASGSDDNLDRGIKMKYNNSGAKLAFMGYDDSDGKFVMIPDATDTSSVFSGTAGTLKANLEGDVTGDLTGNASGTAATVTTAAQPAITSVGTLLTLTVDNVVLDANTITSNSDTDFVITAKAGRSLQLESLVIDAGAVTGLSSVTSVAFVGDITGDVTGDTSGSSGTCTGNAATATEATNVTVAANNSTDETVYLTFVDGATGAQGIETDTGLNYNPSSNILTVVELDVSGDVDIDGTLEADAITVGGTALNTVIAGVTVTNATTAATSTLSVVTDSNTNTSFPIVFHDESNALLDDTGRLLYNPNSGALVAPGEIAAVSLDISGGVDIDGTLEADVITVNGTALNTVIAGVTVSNATLAATCTVADSNTDTNFPVIFHDESSGLLDDTGRLLYNPNSGKFVAPGEIEAGSLDISGDVDVDGTLEADAITVGGTALNTVIAGVTVANATAAATATLATTVTVTNSTTDTDFPIAFHDESNALLDDTAAFEYNPSTGNMTVPKITCDDVVVDGKVITMTGSASDTAVITAGTNGTLSIVTTDAAASAANIQITADGTVDIDSAGALTLDSGGAINLEPAGGSAVLIDGTVSIDGGLVTGVTSLTLADDIMHTGDTTNKIAFTADAQSFNTNGAARINISNSGLQIGTGARVTTILDNDSLGTSDTTLCTQGNVKAYVDANTTGSNAQLEATEGEIIMSLLKAGETVAAGDLLAISTTANGEVVKADCSAAARQNIIGVSAASAAAATAASGALFEVVVKNMPQNPANVGHVVTFSVDPNGAGGAANYKITFQNSGGTSSAWSGTAASIDITVDTTIATVADAIATLLNAIDTTTDWQNATKSTTDGTADDTISWRVETANNGDTGFDISNVNGNLGGDQAIATSDILLTGIGAQPLVAAADVKVLIPGSVAACTFKSGEEPGAGDYGVPVYLSTTAGQATITIPTTTGDDVIRLGYVANTSVSGGKYDVFLLPQFIMSI